MQVSLNTPEADFFLNFINVFSSFRLRVLISDENLCRIVPRLVLRPAVSDLLVSIFRQW